MEKAFGKERKRFWREAIAEKTKASEVDTKRIKVDAYVETKKGEKDELPAVKAEGFEAAESLAAAVEPPPRVHIGSVHPERDFERFVNERKTGGSDLVAPAVEQMCQVILRLAEEGQEFHSKAFKLMILVYAVLVYLYINVLYISRYMATPQAILAQAIVAQDSRSKGRHPRNRSGHSLRPWTTDCASSQQIWHRPGAMLEGWA